ncbi:MAG: preprotein translocase subunit SecE [Mycoplasma sp.]
METLETEKINNEPLEENYQETAEDLVRWRAEKKAARKAKREKKKLAKLELKEEVKKLRVELKGLKEKFKTDKSNSKSKDESSQQRDLIRIEYNDNKIEARNKITQLKYDFRNKYKTFGWRMLKWTYGINKEFNRVIWSSPTNTFKYLGIIIIVIAVFALLFLGIDSIVNIIRR